MGLAGKGSNRDELDVPDINWCRTSTINNTPWKIDMELTNHPFRKEPDLPNLHDYVPCYLQACILAKSSIKNVFESQWLVGFLYGWYFLLVNIAELLALLGCS